MSGNRNQDFGEPRLVAGGVQARVARNARPVREAVRPRSRSVGRRRGPSIRRLNEEMAERHHAENGPRYQLGEVDEDGSIHSRNVKLTVRGRIDTYKGGQIVESTEIEESEYVVIRFKTRQQLQAGVAKLLAEYKKKLELLECDSPKKVLHVTWMGAQDSYDDEHMRRVARRPVVAEMFASVPIDNRGLHGVDVNRINSKDAEQFNCVVEHLLKTYKPSISALTRERIVTLMGNYMDEGVDMVEMKSLGWKVQDVQRFCDHYKISHYVLDGFNRLVFKKVCESSNYPALMYVCEDCHMYPITDHRRRDHISKAFAAKTHSQSSVLAQDNEKKKEAVEEAAIEMFNTMNFYEDIDDLDELAKLSDCVVYYHKLHLKNMLLDIYMQTDVMYEFKHTNKLVTYIKFDNNVHLFANANHKAGCDWNTSMEVADKLGLPYKNQSLAGLSSEYFNKFYHPKGKKQARTAISKSMKKRIMKEQGHQCNMCFANLKDAKTECDHIIPVSRGGDASSRSNLQILCVECHLEKSGKEAAERLANIDNSCSYYNAKTIEIFGQKPLNAVVHNFLTTEEYARQLGKGKKIKAGLDLNKCRTNILRYGNEEEWDCFSVLNDPVPFKEEVHMQGGKFVRGFYFVQSDNLLPLKGNSWLCVAALKHCLKHKVIKMNQIKFALPSSLHLPANYFHKFVDNIQAAVVEPKLWKLMINSLIGILGVRKSGYRDFKILRNKEAAAAYIFEQQEDGKTVSVSAQVFDEEDKSNWSKKGLMIKPDYYEVTFNQERFKEESHFPIFASILQQEACELHSIQMLLEKHGGKLCHANTDNAIALFDSQSQVDAMWAEAQTVFWDKKNEVPKYKLANDIHNYEKVENVNTEMYKYEKPRYYVEKDPGYSTMYEGEKFAAYLLDHLIKKNEGMQIDAMAGSGKTTLARALMAEMDKRDLKYLACTPTHKSAKVLLRNKEDPEKSAKTIDTALGCLKSGGYSSFTNFQKYDFLVIDEKSMIKEVFFMLLYKIKKACPGLKVILIGDWRQIPPCGDRSLTFNYEDSYCVYDLCDRNMLRLNICRRSDSALFNLYSDIPSVDSEMFPTKMYPKNICYLNSTRMKINHFWMMDIYAPKHKHKMLLKAHPSVEKSQDTIVYKGLPVIAMSTRAGMGFANADEFTVVAFDKKNIELKCTEDEDKVITIPASELTHLFAPAYAITAHRAQGSSINEPFGIYDWSKMSTELRYVALSRSTKLRYINMCDADDL